MPHSIKIMMADDQAMFRDVILKELNTHHKISVIGAGGNGKELMELMKKHTPCIVLLDIEMPVMNGFKTFELLKKHYPEVKIIILSNYFNNSFANHFIKNGADAYLSKASDVEVLVEAIHNVHNGQRYLKTLEALPVAEVEFTKQELMVLKETCVGKTVKQIAEALNISVNTVDFHRKNIYLKARVNNSTELTFFAVKKGLLLFLHD